MRVFAILAAVFLTSAHGVQAQPITEADLRGHIMVLASDEFGGRKPGTVGENKTINYIATQWTKAGLGPAAVDGGWYQSVELVERTPLSQKISLIGVRNGKTKSLRVDDDAIVLRGAKQTAHADNVQALFVGHGKMESDVLEELVAGHLVFIHQTVPAGRDDIPDYRKRKAKLIEAGAWAVVGIVKGKWRWERFARRYHRASTTLAGKSHHAGIEGLISLKQIRKLVGKTGINAGQLLKDMEKDDFQPKEIELFADLSVETRVRSYKSHNVIGKIAGSKQDSGAVLFLGHWDHFGECGSEPDTDRICNGAVDNASGIALLIETAKRLVSTKPDRDIYFLATTAEEKGLLGARAFVEQPSFPLDQLEAVFNADSIALAPDGKLLAVVGRGETDLDDEIENLAETHGHKIDKTDSANRFLKRQDGYVFLEKDIPAFMITSAFADKERLDTYLSGRYHDVTDEADEGLILGGAASDANFHVALGKYFGNLSSYPAKAP